jgi:hypothetical protein
MKTFFFREINVFSKGMTFLLTNGIVGSEDGRRRGGGGIIENFFPARSDINNAAN